MSGSFKVTPDPELVTETRTRTRKSSALASLYELTTSVENTPNGFPRLAAFQASDANFGLYRSYSYLHSRVLLDYQDEITSLETELDELDWEAHSENPARLRTNDFDRDEEAAGDQSVRTRRTVLREIKTKLMEYGKLVLACNRTYRVSSLQIDEVLIKARTLESFQKPSDRDYRSVRRYHHNFKPLMDGEMESIRSKEDIVSVSNGRERAAFDGGVETLISRLDGVLKKILGSERPPLMVRSIRDSKSSHID